LDLEAASIITHEFRLFGATFAALFSFEVIPEIIKIVVDGLACFAQNFNQALGLFGIIFGEVGECVSAGTGTSGTANAVNVIFTLPWEVKVDHVNIVNIETTSSHIGGDQDSVSAFAETEKNLVSLVLVQISVNS